MKRGDFLKKLGFGAAAAIIPSKFINSENTKFINSESLKAPKTEFGEVQKMVFWSEPCNEGLISSDISCSVTTTYSECLGYPVGSCDKWEIKNIKY